MMATMALIKTQNPPTNKLSPFASDISINDFYDYRVFNKDLFCSNRKFESKMVNHLKNSEFIPVGENRMNRHVISIDSNSTQDFDDALGFHNGVISVYIANVPDFIEKHNLWSQMKNSCSTSIHNSIKKRSLFPNVLSDNVLSLMENMERNVFYMDIDMNNNMKVSFGNASIVVRKNYIYDTEELHNNETYSNIMLNIPMLHDKFKYIKEVTNSLQLIEYFMVFMNCQAGKVLCSKQMGFFRSMELPMLTDNIENSNNLNNYVHVTSPVRRLVDLINIMILQHTCAIQIYSMSALECFGYWLKHVDKICKKTNNTHNNEKAIEYCKTSLKREFNACVMQILDNNIYVVYLEELKYFGKMFYEGPLHIYDNIDVKMYVSEFETYKIHLEYSTYM